MLFNTVAHAVCDGSWNVDAGGNWSTPSNWTPCVPNGQGDTANFGPVITAPRTVTLDISPTVSFLNFNSSQSYTIVPMAAENLTLAHPTDGERAIINVLQGTHFIQSNILTIPGTSFDFVGPGILNFGPSPALLNAISFEIQQGALDIYSGALIALNPPVSGTAVAIFADQNLTLHEGTFAAVCPELNVGWQREFLDKERTLHFSSAEFSKKSSFRFEESFRNTLIAGAALAFTFAEKSSLEGYYNFEWNPKVRNSFLNLSFNYHF